MDLDQQNIIKMLGIESLPEERKLVILEKLTDLIQKKLLARMLAVLPEQDQTEFAEVLEKNDPKQIQDFVHVHFPDFQDWLAEEVNAVKDDLSQFINQQVPK